jgi:L-threonylcarbamoyladenylate synthase
VKGGGAAARRDELDEAVARIAAGALVAFPTETIWGLAADARSETAVARLRSWKQRADDQPLSVLVTGVHALPALGVEVGRLARELADTFWPGPLTMVLPCSGHFATGVAGPKGALGVRCSPHPVAASLARALEAAGVGPITATSLNRHGEAPARNRAEASRACAEGDAAEPSGSSAAELSGSSAAEPSGSSGEAPLLFLGDGLDAGGGRPSTVVDLTGTKPNVLRWGALGYDFLTPLLRGTMG